MRNVNRTVGTMLGSEVTRRWGGGGLPDDTIDVSLAGSAGQSFGAFLPRGVTLRLSGDANDYLGKGLSGGRVIAAPDPQATFAAEQHVIAGNVIGYGATGGEIFLRGVVGERFCVRNSGATAVAEGTGDHGCEYMTGGRVLVLGPTGRNFAAGMSGGIAYLLDPDPVRVNTEMADLEPLAAADADALAALLARHHAETGSAVAARLLADWPAAARRFARVMPRDYQRVLAAAQRAERDGTERRRGRHGRGAGLRRDAMADPRGFMKTPRPGPARRPVDIRIPGLARGVRRVRQARAGAQAGRCMDCGIPFCHQGCPLGQPDPGVERPGPHRGLAGGGRAAARHQQLPRVHRAAVPGAVRERLRARASTPTR